MPEAIAAAIKQGNLVACAMLSGNRNFEGRINPVVRFNYLASPPLVVAYAIAGTMDFDLERRAARHRSRRAIRFTCATSGRRPQEVAAAVAGSIDSAMFRNEYGQVFDGDERWRGLKVPEGDLFRWEEDSLYVKAPPFFDGVGRDAAAACAISTDARVLAMLGDSVTTDHISPAGSIAADSPAGQVSDRPRRASRRTSTRTARAAAIMK